MLYLYKYYKYMQYNLIQTITNDYIINYNNIYAKDNITLREKGRLLELYFCIKYNKELNYDINKYYLLWEDVPEYLKRKYNFTIYDSGIDCALIDNNDITEIIQCKNFSGILSTTNLEGFCYNYLKSSKSKIQGILFISSTTILCKQLKIDNIFKIIRSDELQSKIDLIINNQVEDININNQQINEKKNKIKLHKFQRQCLKSMEKFISNTEQNDIIQCENNKTFIAKIPCGCGKSIIIYKFVNKHPDKKILILVPNLILVHQFNKLFKHNNPICISCDTHNQIDANSNLIICCYNSVTHVKDMTFDFIIVDEAHHVQIPRIYKFPDQEDVYESFIYTIQNKLNYSYRFYFSATIDNATFNYNLDNAILNNYLVDYECIIHYITQSNHDMINIYNDKLEMLKNICNNPCYKKIIVYCNKIATCNNIKDYLSDYKCGVISSELSTSERNKIISGFKKDEYNILCSVNCLSEGVNIPCIDTCVFFDDRYSTINIIQCLGRCLRLYPGKHKAHMIILTCDINKDSTVYRYVSILNNIDKNFFSSEDENKIIVRNIKKDKLEDNIKQHINDNVQNTSTPILINNVFNKIKKIIIKRKNLIDTLTLCDEYYYNFKCVPENTEIYKDVNLLKFIKSKLKTNDEDIKKELCKIFEYDFLHEYGFIKSEFDKINLDYSTNKKKYILAQYDTCNKWVPCKLSLNNLYKIIFKRHLLENDKFIKEVSPVLKITYNDFVNMYKKMDTVNSRIILNDNNLGIMDVPNMSDVFKFFVSFNINNKSLVLSKQEVRNKIIDHVNEILLAYIDNLMANKDSLVVNVLLKYLLNNSDSINRSNYLKYVLRVPEDDETNTNDYSFDIIYYNCCVDLDIYNYIMNNIKSCICNINIPDITITVKDNTINGRLCLYLPCQSYFKYSNTTKPYKLMYNIQEYTDKEHLSYEERHVLDKYVLSLSLLSNIWNFQKKQ